MSSVSLRSTSGVRRLSQRYLPEPKPESTAVGRTAWWKRATDVFVASLALAALAPLFALIAFLIKRDGGPVFFRQKRVGQNGREFWFYKFRSMVVDAEARRDHLVAVNHHGETGVTFKMRRDPRVTAVGRLLRRASLDELPQLWNVLKGDMSLVGPRPALPAEVARYTPEERARLAVRPGLTCIWQVSGRADIPFEQQVQLDLEYIARRSFWFDLSLLFRTIPAMITGRGAY
ncbi:MAG: sugar transferase [Isosphaeraceae bacterium]